jgi:hypothetical protein
MSTNLSASEIFSSALQLPEAMREQLIDILQTSLVEPTIEHGPKESPEDVENAWDVEIARRLAEIDSGAVKLIPSDEAWKYINGETSPKAI